MFKGKEVKPFDHEIECELFNRIVDELKSRLHCITLEWAGQPEIDIDNLKTKLINEIDFTRCETLSIAGASWLFPKIENDIYNEALSNGVNLRIRIKE